MTDLSFIAFIAHPSAAPLSVVTYACTVAAVSGLEVVMFRHARHFGPLGKNIPDNVYRWGVLASIFPVIVFGDCLR